MFFINDFCCFKKKNNRTKKILTGAALVGLIGLGLINKNKVKSFFRKGKFVKSHFRKTKTTVKSNKPITNTNNTQSKSNTTFKNSSISPFSGIKPDFFEFNVNNMKIEIATKSTDYRLYGNFKFPFTKLKHTDNNITVGSFVDKDNNNFKFIRMRKELPAKYNDDFGRSIYITFYGKVDSKYDLSYLPESLLDDYIKTIDLDNIILNDTYTNTKTRVNSLLNYDFKVESSNRVNNYSRIRLREN